MPADTDTPQQQPKDDWSKARAGLDGIKGQQEQGARLLQKVKDRTLTIEVLGEKLVVRYPTQDRLKALFQVEKDAWSTADLIAIKKGNLEDVSPAARKKLEAQAGGVFEKFVPLAVYLCEVSNPSMDTEFFHANEGGMELAIEVCMRTIQAYREAQNSLVSFRKN